MTDFCFGRGATMVTKPENSRRSGIAPSGAIPPYQRIKQEVTRLITSGHLAEGDRVPSDNELAASFQVSRLTAHRALRELAQERLVQRVHGVGTFVALQRETSSADKIYNIADEVRSSGRVLSAIVSRLGSVAASAAIAAEMAVRDGSALFHSAIVYRADGVPVQLEDRFVAPAFAPAYLAQDFGTQSTTDYLQSIAPADEAEQVIEASVPDATTRGLLKMAKGEACLTVIRKTWVAGRITTYTRFVHPGSRRRLISRMSRTSEAGPGRTSFFTLTES